MIICKTPFRVSLFGGSTDYEEFYSLHESLLIGFTLDKYGYIVLRKTPDILEHKTKISYNKTEIVSVHKNIEHNGVRGVFEFLNVNDGFEITYLSDLPSRTGIGSSSSFIVGLLNSFFDYFGDVVSKKDLATHSIFVERKLLGEPGGIQDQIWATYGGFNSININTDGVFKVKPLPVDCVFKQHFVDRSIMIYTGQSRNSFDLAKENSKSKSNKGRIKELAQRAYHAFLNEDLDRVAVLLKSSWEEKKEISPNISNNKIDQIYNQLTEDGMIGGKLLGSGGSGFIFGILGDGVDRQKIQEKYKHHFVDFNISNEGSQIIDG